MPSPKRSQTQKKGAKLLWENITKPTGRLEEDRARVREELGRRKRLDKERSRLVAVWGKHPWTFLSASAETDEGLTRQILWTKDERDTESPIKPFPGIDTKPYLPIYLDALLKEQYVFVDKPRQMFMTWATTLFLMWDCIFHEARRWLLVKNDYDESLEILRDKIVFAYGQLPKWLKAKATMDEKYTTKFLIKQTGSYILPVACNAAEGEFRGGTASGALIDEAALQPRFADLLRAAQPMAAKIIALTTPQIGNPGARKFKELIDEGKGML